MSRTAINSPSYLSYLDCVERARYADFSCRQRKPLIQLLRRLPTSYESASYKCLIEPAGIDKWHLGDCDVLPNLNAERNLLEGDFNV